MRRIGGFQVTRLLPLSDGIIAFFTWVSCLGGCLIFAGLMIGTTGLLEGFKWVPDQCTVSAQDDQCLQARLNQCSVSVYIRGNPVASPPTWIIHVRSRALDPSCVAVPQSPSSSTPL